MITYICKYTPIELLDAFHVKTDLPNREVSDFALTDDLIHSSVCSHAKMLLEELRQKEESGQADRELVLVNCCDSIRRVNDTVASWPFAFRTMLDLPHRTEGFAVDLYEQELKKFAAAYEAYCGHSYDPAVLLKAWRRNAEKWAAFQNDDTPFIAVLGARPSDELMEKIQASLPYRCVDLTCGGLRSISEPPAELEKGLSEAQNEEGSGTAAADVQGSGAAEQDNLLHAYAAALLQQIPCTRMTDTSRRAALLCHPGLRGIVYHSVRFCDYYSFEYADIRRETDLPMLKIESDYTSQSQGQIATRIQAFGETLMARYPEESRHGGRSVSKNASQNTDSSPLQEHAAHLTDSISDRCDHSVRLADPAGDRYAHPVSLDERIDSREDHQAADIFIGLDSGSTTTNGAAVDRNGHLLASCTIRTGARAGDAAAKVLDQLKTELDKTIPSFDPGMICGIAATGYGREHIPFATLIRTEISCHAKGAHFLSPKARTIIDIGGQDSKVICLDGNGNVTNFVMNDKCAAGTGRFLEMMAHTLEMNLDEMAGRGLSWKKDLNITSTCTVFAESEVVSLIAENSDTDDIIHALDKSVARKTLSMVRRVQGTAPYMMTGGVARNKGVVRELERGLEAPLTVTANPDLCGAIGAALYAAEA